MNVVHLADCLPAMKKMDDNAFDLAVVDPPYGIGNFWNGGDATHQPKISSLRANESEWNNTIPIGDYWDELKRVSIDYIIWGWNYYTEYLGPSESLIIWYKNLGAPNYSQCEIAITSYRHKVRYFEYALAKDNKNRTHPCQKPVALYKWIYANYAKPGDKILDTHVGSGSSRIAAWDAGLDFVGYEIDADYCAAQEARFQDYIKQDELFDKSEMFKGAE